MVEARIQKANQSIDWTPQNIETLRRLWAKGVSTSKIAEALGNGKAKNAVISKARRDKLPPHPNPPCIKKPGKPKAKVVAPPPPPKKGPEPKRERKRGPEGTTILEPDIKALRSRVWEPLPGSKPVPLVDRTGCCWPTSETSPYVFCNEPKADGKSYCPTHQLIMEPKRNDHQANTADRNSVRHKFSHARIAPAGRINFR